MTVMQAYVDDSGNFKQGKTCLLAGYVAPAKVWEAFSERWQAALCEAPAVPFFKMSDAFALKKQFDSWTEEARNAKVDKLVDIIVGAGITYGVVVALDNDDYVKYGRSANEFFVSDPFYFLFTNLMEMCLIHQFHAGINEKIDFIFDTVSKSPKEIESLFKQTMHTAPEKFSNLVKLVENAPLFRDEKEHLPLQAADLLAGQVRGYYERRVLTEALAKLGEQGPPLRTMYYDGRTLETVIKGAAIVRAYTGSSDHSGERFAQIKAFLEKLGEIESRLRNQF